jgi:competence protein ComEC
VWRLSGFGENAGACFNRCPAHGGVVAWWLAPSPDVLVSHDPRMVAVCDPEGRLSLMTTGFDDFTLREWLAADADRRGARDDTLSMHVRCDDLGCTSPLRSGGVVALAQSADPLANDCNLASVMVTQRLAPPQCKAQVIDRNVWQRYGAATLTRTGDGFEIIFARAPNHGRPWAKSPANVAETRRVSAARPAQPDATPRREDMEPGDRSRGNQYRRNRPISLPWIRTRLGGKMRTS